MSDSGIGIVESREWRHAEVPSTNLYATAKGVAMVYAALLDTGGPVSPAPLADARSTPVDGEDRVLQTRSRFGLGFQLHREKPPIGTSADSFGHYGFADPTAGLAVGYVPNRPGDRWQIPRSRRLLAALAQQVESLSS
ncbi:MAG: CubicO group peptidase (beta-lactamase class C family) [Candidatus Aldehydirespiratoraceae bacterium]|jgi:CubicO group peptidase (beta-lactamase class C family)